MNESPALSRRLAVAGLIVATASATAEAPRRRLPDTETTMHGGLSAWLVDPTTRYAHGVLGDAIEAGGFVVDRGGRQFHVTLPQDAVFEDRRVRLEDIDGDGRPEAIVVKSSLRHGAALAVYRISETGIAPLAESQPIGMPNRWLNPVGVADFTGDGGPLVAAVITPHIAGSLRLYRLQAGALVEVARLDGVTNHVIGSRDLDLARISDIDGDGRPEIVLPVQDRTSLAAVSFAGGRGRIVARTAVPSPIVRVEPMNGHEAVVQLQDRRTVTLVLSPG
ncbi:VCBS repeat-containing protein [Phreatobacter aquaticus]|uniref:VCBS repeat-containing protein n=1 Tax=Phreatobacter aquaticus TaxID=2570229 RepID=A0A4D7QH26_9HYPH|nr:VCBS repeat-containing protein [Phreatobacter aquaticus]QCK84754.1 VCBS repeat-containing protein [Phreatobacter aquaticus]